jgi:hypothetical protein
MTKTEAVEVEKQVTVRTVVAGKWIFVEQKSPVNSAKATKKVPVVQ